jgi:hypothetical protein
MTRTRAVSKGPVLRKGPELKIVCGIAPAAYFIGMGVAKSFIGQGFSLYGPRSAVIALFATPEPR